MNTKKKDTADNGLFTMFRIGPATLTHEAVKNYLSNGRRMQSAYVWELVHLLGLWLRETLFRAAKWFGALSEQKRRRCIGIQINRKSYTVRCCPILLPSPCRPLHGLWASW